MAQTASLNRAKKPFRARDAIRPAVYVLGMAPAVWVFYLGFTNQLGADPQKTLERFLGLWSLRYLVAGLAVTPLRQIAGINLMPYRRAIGLLAFFYATLHVLVYLVLDQGMDASAIWADIVKRPYITVGMAAFLILVPLAITSNNAMVRRLRGEAWRRLHKWVYVAAVLGALHFIMLVKTWPPEPLIYAAIITALLAWRVLPARERQRAAPR
jgi:sulfoxide reductase heme-binding subunit YedZ